jgi:small conductance mechanosensitive channel
VEQKTQELMAHAGALLPLVVSTALGVTGALIILLIGWWLADRVNALTIRVLGRTPHFDPMLRSFFGSIVRYLILIVTGLAVLSQFGIQTTSLVAVLGAASLAVGLALQGTLSNLAAGVMLLMFRPFRIGHKVQVGANLGTVRDLSLFWTELVTEDQVQIIMPNGAIWGQPLRNYSIYPAPPPTAELRYRLLADTPIGTVIEKIRAVVEAQPGVLREPAPSVLLDRPAAEDAFDVVVGFATTTGETAAVKSELIKAVRATLATESTAADACPERPEAT